LQPAGYGAYRRIQTETASPADLILQLYDGLLNNLQRADDAMTAGQDLAAANAALLRAQDIVMELVASLDLDAGEIAQQLADLYQYVYQRLIEANVRKDRDAIAEVIRLMGRIRDAWAQIARTAPAAAAPAAYSFRA
jgi:flagellar protein FliS